MLNIRFNDRHTSEDPQGLDSATNARRCCGPRARRYELAFQVIGRGVSDAAGAVEQPHFGGQLGRARIEPELSTSGGTSDARFIKDMCPVVEFGLAGRTMHKVDERVPVADIESLAEIYKAVLDGYFPQ